MEIKVIAEAMGYIFAGNQEQEVFGIRWANSSTEKDIAIARSVWEAQETKAKIVLSDKMLWGVTKEVIFSTVPLMEAARKIADMFVREGIYADYSKSGDFTLTEKLCQMGENVSLGENVRLGSFSVVGSNVMIGDNAIIGEGVSIGAGSVIGNEVIIKAGAKIASPPFFYFNNKNRVNDFAGYGRVIIGDAVTVGTNTVVQRGSFGDTIIGEQTDIGDLVIIGHDVKIGRDCRIVSQSGIAGNAVLGDKVTVMGQCGIADGVGIGNGSTIMAQSGVTKSIGNNKIVSGRYGREHYKELKMRAALCHKMQRSE